MKKKKKDFYIAMCKCCLIAQAMKTCPLCRFNIGLVKEVKLVDSIPLPEPAQVAIFAMSEQGQFNLIEKQITDRMEE